LALLLNLSDYCQNQAQIKAVVYSIDKVDYVRFGPTTSAMPHLSRGYSSTPFKGEVVEREKTVQVSAAHFPCSIALKCVKIKRVIKFEYYQFVLILFSGLNVEPLKGF
jgi:hypothetical protein